MTGNSLDPHVMAYAQRTSGMRASAIRALFAVANRPEVVSLAGGMPYLSSLPLEALAADVAEMVNTDGRSPCNTAPVRATRDSARRSST